MITSYKIGMTIMKERKLDKAIPHGGYDRRRRPINLNDEFSDLEESMMTGVRTLAFCALSVVWIFMLADILG